MWKVGDIICMLHGHEAMWWIYIRGGGGLSLTECREVNAEICVSAGTIGHILQRNGTPSLNGTAASES